MGLAGLVVAFGVLVVSGVAAAAAVIQARAANDAKRDAQIALTEARKARDDVQDLARVSTAAFVRQAEAQEKANLLKEEQMRPAAWSPPKWVSGDLHAVTKTSRRPIKVDSFEIEPEGAENLIRIGGPENGLYAYGDSFDYMVSNRLSVRVRKLTVNWRYEDEPKSAVSRYIIPL